MSNDFKPVMVRNVEFKYPRLHATYKYNTAQKRSEECPPRAQGAAYSIGWEMSADDARTLHNELKDHYNSCVTKTPFTKVFGMNKLENGRVEFRAKRNGCNAQGEESKKPNVIGGDKKPLADTAIWGGSKGSLRVTAFPATDPDGKGGISLLIDTVQVTHAVYGGASLDDFDDVATTMSGGENTSLDDFGPATAADPFGDIKAPAPANDLGGDDIPF